MAATVSSRPGGRRPEAASRSLPNSHSVTPELLNELIRQKPANVGVALRDWVAVPSGKN